MYTITDNILTFDSKFNDSIDQLIFPQNIKTIIFGDKFNQQIDNVMWPDTLISITFGNKFSYPINRSQFPESFKSFTFSKTYLKHITHTNEKIQKQFKEIADATIESDKILKQYESELDEFRNSLNRIALVAGESEKVDIILKIEDNNKRETELNNHLAKLSTDDKKSFLELYESEEKRIAIQLEGIAGHTKLISDIFTITNDTERQAKLTQYICKSINSNLVPDDDDRFELLEKCIVNLTDIQKKEIIDLYIESIKKCNEHKKQRKSKLSELSNRYIPESCSLM